MFDWIDRLDLSGVHIVATFTGMLLSIFASQAMWLDPESRRDCLLVRLGRRVMYPVLALSFLWSLDYSHVKGWQPWPPTVAIIIAMDFIIAMRIVALRHRQRISDERGWSRPFGVDADTR